MSMTFLEDLGMTRYHNPVSRLSKENGPLRSSGAYENGHAFVTRYPFFWRGKPLMQLEDDVKDLSACSLISQH